jgi:hypothetical protein
MCGFTVHSSAAYFFIHNSIKVFEKGFGEKLFSKNFSPKNPNQVSRRREGNSSGCIRKFPGASIES